METDIDDSGSTPSMEVPLLFHRSPHFIPRYRVNAEGRSVYLINDLSVTTTDPQGPITNSAIFHTLDEDDWKAQMVGSASMRMFFLNQQKFVITTQALVEEPHVICIRVLMLETAPNDSSQWKDTQFSSSIQIDLGPLLTFLTDHPEYPAQRVTTTDTERNTSFWRLDATQHMRKIVKTACFRHKEDDVSPEDSDFVDWDVVFVDNKGSILTIQLRYDHANVQLRPLVETSTFSDDTTSIRFISMYASHPPFWTSTAKWSVHRTSISDGVTLVSSQVDFLDSHRVLLAISPCILCVHTITGMVASWSANQCILGENDTPTILTFRMPQSTDSSGTALNRNEDFISTTFTLGRTATAESIRKKRQSISSIFKNASGLLQGKSVVDMFMEQQKELRKRRTSYRASRQQDAYTDMDEESDDPLLFPRGNTNVYDAFLEEVEYDGNSSQMAAVCALTVLRSDPPWDPSVVYYDYDSGPVKAVFSLHADGTIRLWTMPDDVVTGDVTRENIYPLTMKVLYDSNFVAHESQNIPLLPIPPPHTWSSSFDSVTLTCKLSKVNTDSEIEAEPSNLLGSLLKTPKKTRHLNMQDDDSEGCEWKYALVVSIRAINIDLGSSESGNRSSGMSDEYSTVRYSSPCNLTLFRGQIFDTAREPYSSQILIDRLQVPREAKSFATMAFNISSPKDWKGHFSFNVVYNCLEMLDGLGLGASANSLSSSVKNPTLLVSYDTMSLNACRLEHINTLDDLAFSERNDFITQSIACQNSDILESIMEKDEENHSRYTSEEDDIDRTVHFIESLYMKRLFRSCWGRSLCGGTVSEGSIRRALLQVCPHFILTDSIIDNERCSYSLEIDTLTAMRAWANHQEAKYFAERAKRKRNENELNASYDLPNSSLYTTMTPRSLLNSLEVNSTQVAGISVQKKTGDKSRILNGHHSRWMKLLHSVWNEESKIRMPIALISFPSLEDEYKVMLLRTGLTSCISISSSQQPCSPSRLELLDQLSLRLLNHVKNGDYNTRLRMAAHEIFVQQLTFKASLAISGECAFFEILMRDLSALGSIDDPVLSSRLDDVIGSLSDDDIRNWLGSLPFCLRKVDHTNNRAALFDYSHHEKDTGVSHRSLLPCSSILVMKAVEEMRQLSLSRFMTLSRRVDLDPELGLTALRIYLTITALKWSFNQVSSEISGPNPISRVGNARVIDFAVARFSQRTTLSLNSYYDFTIQLSDGFVVVIHSEVISSPETDLKCTIPISLKDRCKFVLRLISPLVSYPIEFNCKERQKFRESAAICIVNEIGSSLQNSENKSLLDRASSLLKQDSSIESFWDHDTDQVLGAIQNGPSKQTQYPLIPDDTMTEYLNSFLALVFDDNMRLYIQNLSRMETFISLLQPWINVSLSTHVEPLELIAHTLNEYVSDVMSSLRVLSTKFLVVACLIHRIDVLMNESLNQSTTTILSAISDAIYAIKRSFPASFYEGYMVEYSQLWSNAFHHALMGRQWRKSFEALMANPSNDLKISEFRQLVLTMADVGEFDCLLDLNLFDVANATETTDETIKFYELASDTLTAAADETSYNGSSFFPTTHANYIGCLYALHAAKENWSRCAQTMDYFGLIRVNLLQRSETALDNKDYERKIIDDLTLSIVASLQLSQLNAVNDSNADYNIRPSRFEKDKPLASQASKMIALRLIYFDSLSALTASEVISVAPADIMLYLAQLGYMSHYIAMAEIKGKSNNGYRPGGRELVADAITYLIHEFLAPASLRSSCVVNEDIIMNDIPRISSRPSAAQLFQSNSGQVLIPDLWRSHEQIIKLSRADSAMELIRSYTERYSNPSNVLAVEVANTLLELDMGQAALPSWLETMLLGPPKDRGLFAAKGGNPCALILVYIRWGMLLEAASVVTLILSGNGFDRKKVVTSRLPEKGHIDFVPYKIIDLLWDLIGKEIADPNIDHDTRKNLHRARSQMEQTLKEHFELIKISDTGLHSARVLNQL